MWWRCSLDTTVMTLLDDNTNVLKYEITLMWNLISTIIYLEEVKNLKGLWRTSFIYGGQVAQYLKSINISAGFLIKLFTRLTIHWLQLNDKQFCSRKRIVYSRVMMARQICVRLAANKTMKDTMVRLRTLDEFTGWWLVIGSVLCLYYYR